MTTICNRRGLDTISAGTMIAFALECCENRISTEADVNGIEPIPDNSQAVPLVLDKMAFSQGIGNESALLQKTCHLVQYPPEGC